jgi:hypothetical protein
MTQKINSAEEKPENIPKVDKRVIKSPFMLLKLADRYIPSCDKPKQLNKWNKRQLYKEYA